MILILEDQVTTLGAALEKACALRDVASVRLMPEQMVRGVGVDLSIDGKVCAGSLTIGGQRLALSDVRGVYCSLDTFGPSLWPEFSSRDASYAAMETHATWLALMHSLPCGSVNPPAPEALGGPLYSPSELFLAARRSSLHVAATACLGLPDAMALADEPIAASVYDLGLERQSELPLTSLAHTTGTDTRRHVRIRERLPGQRISICVMRRSMFASVLDSGIDQPRALSRGTIPDQVVEGVRALHARLGFVLAEYQFVRLATGDWILDDHGRAPGPMTWAVHADALVTSALECILAAKGDPR